jgi:hypothetical protein
LLRLVVVFFERFGSELDWNDSINFATTPKGYKLNL